MHPHRIDAAHPRALTPAETGRRSAPRVVGLGAPLSVRIRLQPCEVPALRERICEQLRPAIDRDIPPNDILVRVDDPGEASAWEAMLAQLELADDDGRGIEVLWPTALAMPVIDDAVTAALNAIPRGADGRSAPRRLASTLAVAAALADTWQELLAVDTGGLQEIWL